MGQDDLTESRDASAAAVRSNPAVEDESPAKRIKLDAGAEIDSSNRDVVERKKGIAPIKKEYLILNPQDSTPGSASPVRNDDEAEAARHEEREGGGKQGKGKGKGKAKRGQNKSRKFGSSTDEKSLCQTRAHRPEFSPETCPFGDNCRFEHDLRKYITKYKREDLTTFEGLCPVWNVYGVCFSGWKCRFVGSHMKERELEDGRKEMILVEDDARKESAKPSTSGVTEGGVANVISTENKADLMKKRFATPKADSMIKWFDISSKELSKNLHGGNVGDDGTNGENLEDQAEDETKEEVQDNRASYTEPPLFPSEKRRLYFGPETPLLSPLTTQGNLPFRRLCVEMGAAFTYSEMAMSLPLMQGHKGEWALMKAHESEVLPPTINPTANIVKGYEPSRDKKFGAQISASKPWQALKATEILTSLCPHLRLIDLNCGCPIDLVYQTGAGSALLDAHPKLEKILRGMNSVSGEVPITAKIRMGTKDKVPTAQKLAERLVLGGHESNEQGLGAPGIGALTLHGRSRQQRYTRLADWEYIAECSALVKRLNEEAASVTDTVREPDGRTQPSAGKVFFIGNGDCYSHEDYYRGINESGVDSVMIARGALMKPWIFEEIKSGQYLDKSASERLSYIEKFTKYGLEAWGSDEQGVGNTRRFLLELLSFTYRYVPVGLLEYLPPNIQDRPPAWRGRNELETLMASDNYKDWIKISEMFLGPAHKDFKFQPKHKSNSYDVAEG